MATCFLVLGTPRSGTSAVAGVLHHLGLPMGDELLAADDWNPAGYFQDAAFERVLKEELRGEFPVFAECLATDRTRGCERIGALTAARAARGSEWGLKSNRIAYFFDAFLAAAGEVRVIGTSRKRAESIASYQARQRCSREAATAVIDNMQQAIESVLKIHGITPITSIDFHDLLSDPHSAVDVIASAIGRTSKGSAVSWIDASLRRFSDA
jgi:hypothetical protein